MTTTTAKAPVFIDSDPSCLGDAATEEDLEGFAENLSAHLAKRFPDRALTVVTRGDIYDNAWKHCPGDEEVAQYVSDLLSGDAWIGLLPVYRYEIRPIVDADCTRVADRVLAATNDLKRAKDEAASHSGSFLYGTAIVDTETGLTDWGGGFGASPPSGPSGDE